jgi:hypothetical protein
MGCNDDDGPATDQKLPGVRDGKFDLEEMILVY